MDYKDNDQDEAEYGGEKKKKSWMFRAFKWIIYSVSAIVVIITVYRCSSTAMPADLKNYIIGSPKIEQAYNVLEKKDDFVIYTLDIRNAFARGDAFFADNVRYLESAETLQLTLRCKTSRFPDLFGAAENTNLAKLFKVYLKISETSESPDADYEIMESAGEARSGKSSDSYVYFLYSFDEVKIDYAKSKIELYVFYNDPETSFDEDECLARFTLFDVNMPKTKEKMKKFTIHN